MTEINIITILAAATVLIVYGLFMVFRLRHKENKEKKDWSNRLGKVLSHAEEEEEKALSLLKEKVGPESYFKSKLPKVEGLKEWILHSGLNINPTIFSILSGAIGISIGLVFYFVLKANIIFCLLLATVSSFLIPWAIITMATARRKGMFLEEFPIALDMIRRALRAGHSADRALEMVAKHSSGPVGDAFKIVTEKMRLGEPIEIVLGDMANRLGIDDFRMLAIVLVLQRETGGSLAEAVDNFSKIIRSRQNLRKKMSALTAEVRVTAAILSGIPFFILGAVYITSPAYLDPLFYTSRGNTLLIIGGLMLTIGITVIVRMAYKDVY